MRDPIVAGRFYPEGEDELRDTIAQYMQVQDKDSAVDAIAAIAPHAGYIYSGRLAAKTLHSVAVPETVLLLGPNHTGNGQSISLSAETWSTPLGDIPTNQELLAIIEKHSAAAVDEAAHSFEHSLEVQLPFLQFLRPDVSMVACTIKQLSLQECELFAQQLAEAITSYSSKVLIVASTDMSHYESRSSATKKDRLALNAIEAMDAQALYSCVWDNQISMCGFIPVVVTILTSQILGANRARIIDYTDSGDVSGDIQQVVGYAGVIIEN